MANSPVLAARALREALAGFEPEAFSGAECATVAEELAQASKAAAAASARAAARAARKAGEGHKKQVRERG